MDMHVQNCPHNKTRRGEVQRRIDEALHRHPDGLTVDQLSKETKLKKDSIYKVLSRMKYPYKLEEGVRVYLHPEYGSFKDVREEEVLDALEDILVELDHDVAEHPSVNPLAVKIVTLDKLAGLVFGKVKAMLSKDKSLPEPLKEKHYEKVKKIILDRQDRIDEIIRRYNLRVRIGGVNY
jgi:hypothetical protein